MKMKNILWYLELAHLGGEYSHNFFPLRDHVYSTQEGAEREQGCEACVLKASLCR